MTVNLQPNEIMLRCSCNLRSHVAYLVHEPDDSRGNNLKAVDDDWYLSVGLDPVGFWRRLWLALRFVWNPAMKYHGYAELVLTNSDMDALTRFINDRRSI